MARVEFAGRDSLEFAAEGGAPDALFELGLMYCAGRDVEIDFVTAHKWLNLAALRGNEAARRYRMDLAAEMTKAEIAKAQKLARDWIATH